MTSEKPSIDSLSQGVPPANEEDLPPADAEEMTPIEAQHIERINSLTGPGRTNWLVMLAYLAFAVVTTLGVSDVDFFVEGNQTDLPLAGIKIPTSLFFYFAPMSGAALYVYLHLHVRKVTEALVQAPATIMGRPLESHIQSWLLNDYVLRKRLKYKFEDGECIYQRPMDRLASLITVTLVWLSGPFALCFIWVRTWPAHNLFLSTACAISLLFSIYAGMKSWRLLKQKTGAANRKKKSSIDKSRIVFMGIFLIVLLLNFSNSKVIFVKYYINQRLIH